MSLAKTIVCVAFLLLAVGAGAQTAVTVPGTADPWLAGAPPGSTASCGEGQCDQVPAESPVLVPLTLNPGSTLTITASGSAGYGPTAADQSGPDGCCYIQAHAAGEENGVPAFSSLLNSLLGVFVGSTGKQIFLIGSSKTVTVPAGATQLYLGIQDGFGWWDNSGAFMVKVSASCQGQSQSTTTVPCITAPSDGANPQSQFAAISGTGTPGHTLDVLVGGFSVGSVVVDSEGNWEALPYVSLYGSSVTIQVEDQTSSDSSNTITVHPSMATFLPGPSSPPNSLTALLPLRKADIFVTASDTSPQYVIYGPNYTHVALYLGGDTNGTPLIAEAVTAAEAGSLIGSAGQVRSIPLDQSLMWTQSQRVSAWDPQVALSGVTRSAIVAWAQSTTSQVPPYWSAVDFGLIPAANALFVHTGGLLSARLNTFLNAIATLKYSNNAFICSTFVWRAYYEGTGHSLDLSSPNLLSAQPGSLMASYSPAFIAQLATVFIVPETFVRSPQLKQIF